MQKITRIVILICFIGHLFYRHVGRLPIQLQRQSKIILLHWLIKMPIVYLHCPVPAGNRVHFLNWILFRLSPQDWKIFPALLQVRMVRPFM